MYNGMISLRPRPVYIRVQYLGGKPPRHTYGSLDTYIYNYQIYSNTDIGFCSILSREGRNSEAAKYLQMAIAYDPSVERLLKECEEGMDDQPKSEEK